ncbi:LCP family protein [Ruminococcus sp. HUN007]|uniref:LCP family glycopolymer transferase n=1 Tax=Ruminococcus sp. HUN007 TaxID=1514668 RepID=UPI0005D2D1D8|nr:LCP family protein [Ruminococcus sp. HUN007]
MALFKKRKKESVAIPFLISMVITLLVIGIPVFTLYNQKVNKSSANNGEITDTVFMPTEDNDTTILFSYTPDDKSLRPSFMILRTSAMSRTFTFIPVSNDLLCGSEKMINIFKKGGIIELTKAVNKTFDTKIDRYVNFDDKSLSILCDTLGGINFNVPEGLKGLNAGTQFLDSTFIIKLITNPKYAEDARTVATGNLFADMLGGTSTKISADMIEYAYTKDIDLVETDITALDYDNQKSAIEYMFSSTQYVSTYRVPAAKGNAEQGLTLDKDTLKQLKADSGLK